MREAQQSRDRLTHSCLAASVCVCVFITGGSGAAAGRALRQRGNAELWKVESQAAVKVRGSEGRLLPAVWLGS